MTMLPIIASISAPIAAAAGYLAGFRRGCLDVAACLLRRMKGEKA